MTTAASPVLPTDAATASPSAVPTPDAVPLVNPATGQPLIDPDTGQQMIGVPVAQPTTFLDPSTGKPLLDPATGDPVTAIAAPVPSPTPTSDAMAAADGVKEAVSQKSQTFGSMVDTLDSMALQMGHVRLSVWDVLFASAIVLLIIAGAWLVNKALRALVDRASRLDDTQRLLSEKIITIIVWVVAFFFGVDLLGIDLTAFTLFSGAFGLAIGFGLQKTFGNLIAGIILLMDKSIKPGDVIAIADQSGASTFGQIRKIGIRAVSITTRDQKEYLIPNENLMINQVENWSYSSKNVRIQVPVGVGYHCDIRRAEELMLQAASEVKRIKKTPPPVVWLKQYGESSVDFVINCWISDPEDGVGNVRSEVLKRLWDLFLEAGIEVPFPQRDINLRGNAEFEQLVAAIAQRVDKAGKD